MSYSSILGGMMGEDEVETGAALEVLSKLPRTDDRQFYLDQGTDAELSRLLELISEAYQAGEFHGKLKGQAKQILTASGYGF